MGWELVRIGDICMTGAGGTPLKSKIEYFDGGTIPWLMSGEVAQGEIYESEKFITQIGLDNSSAKIFPEDTVLVAMYGATAGQVGILRCEAATNQAVCGILPNSHFSPEFMFYAMLSKQAELISTATGNAQPNISQIKVKNTKIPLPPLPEQKRIVAILDEAFAGISQAVAHAEKNLANARELFDSYLNNVFTRKGEGWVEKKLGEIASIEYGYTDKSTDEGDYRYIRITDTGNNGELTRTAKKYIKASKEAEKFSLRDNDLLMARTGATFAKVLLYKDYEPSIFASYLIRINFKQSMENELYWYFSKTAYYWEQANSLSSGSAQPHFNGKALKQVCFPYPKFQNEQRELIKRFRGLSAETKHLETIYQQKLDALAELKQSILQKAFRGELTAEGAALRQET